MTFEKNTEKRWNKFLVEKNNFINTHIKEIACFSSTHYFSKKKWANSRLILKNIIDFWSRRKPLHKIFVSILCSTTPPIHFEYYIKIYILLPKKYSNFVVIRIDIIGSPFKNLGQYIICHSQVARVEIFFFCLFFSNILRRWKIM